MGVQVPPLGPITASSPPSACFRPAPEAAFTCMEAVAIVSPRRHIGQRPLRVLTVMHPRTMEMAQVRYVKPRHPLSKPIPHTDPAQRYAVDPDAPPRTVGARMSSSFPSEVHCAQWHPSEGRLFVSRPKTPLEPLRTPDPHNHASNRRDDLPCGVFTPCAQ